MEYYSYTKYGAEEKEAKSRTDALKSKRPSRKKNDNKSTKAPLDIPEILTIPDVTQELDLNLANYACKLQFELLYTRKKIKKQRKMFESLLKSLLLSFDSQHVTSDMIEEYIRSVSQQVDGESDFDEEEEEISFGKDPYKKVITEETGVSTNLIGVSIGAQNLNTKNQEKLSSKGNNTSKQQANVIKINLSDPGISQQVVSSKAKGSKKNSKAEKPEVVVLDQPPQSPKKKPVAAKKENKKPQTAAKKDSKKVAENNQPQKEPQIGAGNAVKISDSRELSQKSVISVEQPLTTSQHFHQSPIKNQMLLKPNNMVANMFNQFAGDDFTRMMQGTGAQINNADIYNYSKMFNGMNSKEMEKLYRNFLPPSFDK